MEKAIGYLRHNKLYYQAAGVHVDVAYIYIDSLELEDLTTECMISIYIKDRLIKIIFNDEDTDINITPYPRMCNNKVPLSVSGALIGWYLSLFIEAISERINIIDRPNEHSVCWDLLDTKIEDGC